MRDNQVIHLVNTSARRILDTSHEGYLKNSGRAINNGLKVDAVSDVFTSGIFALVTFIFFCIVKPENAKRMIKARYINLKSIAEKEALEKMAQIKEAERREKEVEKLLESGVSEEDAIKKVYKIEKEK